MIDIDNFKKPNDGCGHDFGNVVLVHVVAILRNVAEAEGFIVGRQGGEGFIALLTGTSEIEAVAIAESHAALAHKHQSNTKENRRL